MKIVTNIIYFLADVHFPKCFNKLILVRENPKFAFILKSGNFGYRHLV